LAEFKEQWSLEMALEVLCSATVDSRTWSDAVKWLLLYGPPDIREILTQASSSATSHCYPGLRAKGFAADGQSCYDVRELADFLGIPEVELLEKIAKIEQEAGVRNLFDPTETHELQ